MSSQSKKQYSESSFKPDSQKTTVKSSLEQSGAEARTSDDGAKRKTLGGNSGDRSLEDGSTQRTVIDGVGGNAARENLANSDVLLDSFEESLEERDDVRNARASYDSMESTDALDALWEEVPLGTTGSSASTRISEQRREHTVISSSTLEDNGLGDDFSDLKPGSKFGQFTIIRYVGGGGMGRVYEGEDRNLERKVAIKILPQKRAREDGVAARFLNEAKSAARLNHENIAQVYLYGNENGIPYIAFEYVDGVNLRDYVRDCGALELSEAVDYVLQTAAALSHAAAHGVTHRDVKPSNIIVTPQKRVKLIDMGLARLLKPQLDDDLTESGVTLGTFDYISPEQARDPRLADARSDVYSLGCTFY